MFKGKKILPAEIIIIGAMGTIVIIVAIFYIFVYWAAPPPPAIKYGEFSFRFEYEKQGEYYVIEDVLIAEFGQSRRGSVNGPPSRSWDFSLESGRSSHISIKHEEGVRIYFYVGSAGYFMGDLEFGRRAPGIIVFVANEEWEKGRDFNLIEDSYEILRDHGIRLISWERDEPIINSFK